MARRHEMTCDRRVKRCMDLFWKLRRETERGKSEGGEVEDAVCCADEGQLPVGAEVGSEGAESVPCTAKNVTNDANEVEEAVC